MKTALVLVSKIFPEAQIYWIESAEIDWKKYSNFLVDSVDTELWINPKKEWLTTEKKSLKIVSLRPGVTDNPAHSFKEMLMLHPDFSGMQFNVYSGAVTWGETELYQNALIHKIESLSTDDLVQEGLRFPKEVFLPSNEGQVETIPLLEMSDSELVNFSEKNFWALSLDELKTIQKHYAEKKKNPTDIEMEVFAQTWSEHCKHKIFGAKIEYSDANEKFTVDGIYPTYIKNLTKKLNKPWAISVFKDNAGVVEWDDEQLVCIKVETHNSPSALDPYGGALTGILGVNRDVLGCGMGFKPVANTNVLCFGNWDETEKLPERLLHPKKIMTGVHKGIQDGGNKSGIPTVNGAFLFDENFSGKPLVFCGTVGIAPKKIKDMEMHKKYAKPGDLIVMLGGRVGADGIHGATASSLALDENTPNSMVQIGDPLTQKRVTDFLLEAQNFCLYSSITDNGAGGLSSSVGEMAEATNGATIDLKKVPLKYNGLKPWQILVSESQERMTVAVRPDQAQAFLELAQKRQVEASVVGEFTESGRLDVLFAGKKGAELDLHFLHHGLPQMKLKAHFDGKKEKVTWKKNKIINSSLPEKNQTILETLASDRTLASKEGWIRQYDHEVQGATVVKPFDGIKQTAPNDAGVIWLGAGVNASKKGIAVASGICPQYSHWDTELMAKLAVDECVRNLLCHGVRPDRVALLDNFCWPDPLPGKNNPDAEHKLAQLVRASRGMYEICLDYQMPLISGKDSMKNDYKDKNISISVPPTLLVTGIGLVENVEFVTRSSIKKPGHLVYEIGPSVSKEYFGYELVKHFKAESLTELEIDSKNIFKFYEVLYSTLQKNLVSSLHDISEGGLLFSLFESVLQHKLGVEFSKEFEENLSHFYSETPGRFIASVLPEHQKEFEEKIPTVFRRFVGLTNASYEFKLKNERFELNSVEKKWRVSWE